MNSFICIYRYSWSLFTWKKLEVLLFLVLAGSWRGLGVRSLFRFWCFRLRSIFPHFFMFSTKRNNILDRFISTIFALFNALKRLNLIEDCRWRRSQKLQIESWLESWASEVLICCKIIPSLSGKAFLLIKYYFHLMRFFSAYISE